MPPEKLIQANSQMLKKDGKALAAQLLCSQHLRLTAREPSNGTEEEGPQGAPKMNTQRARAWAQSSSAKERKGPLDPAICACK